MAWQELLWRDRGRLSDALLRLNECPLGAGAVAGTGFALDRSSVAAELGFGAPMKNSIDATASRDFLMETCSALTILGVHLSRIGEEIVLWSSVEFGYVVLSDAFATSSSMMPQKKNPDVAELVRGKAARLVGAATSLFVLEKSLCFGYGRDLQEDKRPIFDAFDDAITSLQALSGAIATLTFNRERMRQALERGHLCATDLADALVSRGLPFRQAHQVVGGLVREAERLGVRLAELPDETLERAHAGLSGGELSDVLDPARAVERRQVLGGPARERVIEAIAEAKERWANDAGF
jgi:argininosuccinate lyase